MNFPCPKCNAMTELDGSHIPEDGASVKCPECKTRFWIARETFARRALRKEGKALCSHCTNELGTYLDCPTCGAMYPDVCVVQLAKPVTRKQRKTSAAIGFSIRPERRTHSFTAAKPAERSSRTLLKIVILLVAVALVAAALGIPYLNKRVDQAYSASFFRAIHALKMGTDYNFQLCAKLSADARATGQNLSLLLTDKDKSILNSGKTDIDLLMGRIPKPPEKYNKVNENLAKLYGIYTQSYTLASAPSGPLPAFANRAASMESEFKKASQDLKGSMPPEQAEEFKKIVAKYKKMENF